MSMDVSLKQRLIGAVVLILLAVIFLPLLVKGPAPDSGVSNASLRMPAEPQTGAGTVSEDLPLDAPVGGLPAGGATGMPTPVAGQAPATDATTPLAAVAAGDFVVSFGNYKDAADADRVIAALRAAGLPGYREQVMLGDRQAQRVRIGPFPDQATAESARIRAGQVNSAAGAKVIALDAAAPAAVPAAAPAPDAKPAASQTPAKPAAATVAAAPAPATAAPQAAAKPAAPAPAPAAAKPTPATPTPAATKPTTPAVTAAAEPPPRAPANPANTGFVVQMGAFSDAAAATALRDKLRGAGFNAFTDTVPGNGGKLTRVRVGPVMTRTEADALKAQVKSKAGLDGNVRPHP